MQTQVWSGTNWPLIVGLIFGSAALALLGDVLGFKYGKQRISVFGLRPRYTSRLITAVTGAIISIVILTALSLFSQDVRTALFSMQYIQQQLMDLRVQLQSSQNNTDQALEDLSLPAAAWRISRACCKRPRSAWTLPASISNPFATTSWSWRTRRASLGPRLPP